MAVGNWESIAGSQYDAYTIVALRCVEHQIVNTFSHLRASASVDTQRNAGVEKISTPASPVSTFAMSDQSESFIFT